MKVSKYYVSVIMLFALSCDQHTKRDSQMDSELKFNMTRELISELNWMNQPHSVVTENNSLKILVKKGTDFFNNPEDSSIVGSAPFLYQEVEGDFVFKALVQPDFSAQWNAVAAMLYIDSLNWIKFAFENSDATGPGIVSVVTKGTSDDANGVVLNDEAMVWLALVRKDNIYSMHWSTDGHNYKMARLTSIKDHSIVRVGIEAQSPVGDMADHQVHFFEIKRETVEDLRSISGNK